MHAKYPRSFKAKLYDEEKNWVYSIRLRFDPTTGLRLPSVVWRDWLFVVRGSHGESKIPGVRLLVDFGRYTPFTDRVLVSGLGYIHVVPLAGGVNRNTNPKPTTHKTKIVVRIT